MSDDNFTYRTIKASSEGEYKEKGSKFIARAYPVSNEEEVKTILANLRKEFHDARHHCYAYMYGKDGEHYRANDDGEPNHSAGDPILGQIRSFELTNVLIVVIRYFGGTKLGVSGLINAYKTAAKEALDKATIGKMYWMTELDITTNYSAYNELMALIKNNHGSITEEQYNNDEVKLSFRIPEKFVELFDEYL